MIDTAARTLLLAACLLQVSTACSDVSATSTPEKVHATAASTERLSDGSVRDTFLFDEFDTQAAVDVLIIDDNSDSMRQKQEKLAARLGSFLGTLGKIDWQIGITTTDTSTGTWGLRGSLVPFPGLSTSDTATGQVRILTAKHPDYAKHFADAIVRKEAWDCGTDCPSIDERPLSATILAMDKRDTDNWGFFREGADLVVIILSDEDEASEGGPTATKPSEVVAFARDIFGPNKSLTGFALIIRPGDTTCYNSESVWGAHYGHTLAAFAALTGGETGSICATDYGPALSSIGKRVREGIRTAVLSATPKDGQITVTVTPPDPTLTWTLEGRVVTFAHPPKAGTKVVVGFLEG